MKTYSLISSFLIGVLLLFCTTPTFAHDATENTFPDLRVEQLYFFQKSGDKEEIIVPKICNRGDHDITSNDRFAIQVQYEEKTFEKDITGIQIPQNTCYSEIDTLFFPVRNFVSTWGNYSFRATVDPHNTVQEKTETNNTLQQNLSVLTENRYEPLPDLTVEDLWVTYYNKDNQDIPTLYAKICNYGRTRVMAFDEGLTVEVTTSSVQKSYTLEYFVIQKGYCAKYPVAPLSDLGNLGANETGYYPVIVTADTTNIIEEQDETNNTLQQYPYVRVHGDSIDNHTTYEVEYAPTPLEYDTGILSSLQGSFSFNNAYTQVETTLPDLFISDIELSQTTNNSSADQIRVILCNRGGGTVATPLYVRLESGSTLKNILLENVVMNPETCGVYPLGSRSELSLLQSGVYSITVHVDTQNIVHEYSEENNAFSKSLSFHNGVYTNTSSSYEINTNPYYIRPYISSFVDIYSPPVNGSTSYGFTNPFEQNAVSYLQDQGVLSTEHVDFNGDGIINRAEAAKTVILATNGEVYDYSGQMPFDDTAAYVWYTKYIWKAKQIGLVDGYGRSNSFVPEKEVTTAEFLKMLSEAHNFHTNRPHNYSDYQSYHWVNKYAAVAERFDLFPQRGGTLTPERPLSRSEAAIAIYRIKERTKNIVELTAHLMCDVQEFEEFVAANPSSASLATKQQEMESLFYERISNFGFSSGEEVDGMYDLIRNTSEIKADIRASNKEKCSISDAWIDDFLNGF